MNNQAILLNSTCSYSAVSNAEPFNTYFFSDCRRG